MTTLAFNLWDEANNAAKSAVDSGKKVIDGQTQQLAQQLKDQAKAFLQDAIIERDKQVKSTIATGVIIGVGGCLALVAVGYLLAKK